jgi:hypothetical protein
MTKTSHLRSGPTRIETRALGCDLRSQHELAWALADAVEHRLMPPQRAAIYATLGAGEMCQTITVVLRIALHRGIRLPAELIDDAQQWLGGYVGTDQEAEMRDLIDGLRTVISSPALASPQLEPRSSTIFESPTAPRTAWRRAVTQK